MGATQTFPGEGMRAAAPLFPFPPARVGDEAVLPPEAVEAIVAIHHGLTAKGRHDPGDRGPAFGLRRLAPTQVRLG